MCEPWQHLSMPVMRERALLSVGLLAWICGCSEPDMGKGIFTIAETVGDDGLFEPDVDLPAEGEPPVLLPSGECVQIPKPGVFGYTHQCDGRTRLSVEARGEVYDEYFEFGPGQVNADYWLDPDSYELPLVAACCGPFNYQNPTLDEKMPYIKIVWSTRSSRFATRCRT